VVEMKNSREQSIPCPYCNAIPMYYKDGKCYKCGFDYNEFLKLEFARIENPKLSPLKW
jgi:hypothetical protein